MILQSLCVLACRYMSFAGVVGKHSAGLGLCASFDL